MQVGPVLIPFHAGESRLGGCREQQDFRICIGILVKEVDWIAQSGRAATKCELPLGW